MKEKVLTLLKSANHYDILLAFELMRSRMSVAELLILGDSYSRIIVECEAKGGDLFFRVTGRFSVAYSRHCGCWLSELDLENYPTFINLGNHPEYDTRENKEIAKI